MSSIQNYCPNTPKIQNTAPNIQNENAEPAECNFQAIYKSALDLHLFVSIMHKAIVEKVRDKTANICVVGLGYVGLPTAVFFAMFVIQ